MPFDILFTLGLCSCHRLYISCSMCTIPFLLFISAFFMRPLPILQSFVRPKHTKLRTKWREWKMNGRKTQHTVARTTPMLWCFNSLQRILRHSLSQSCVSLPLSFTLFVVDMGFGYVFTAVYIWFEPIEWQIYWKAHQYTTLSIQHCIVIYISREMEREWDTDGKRALCVFVHAKCSVCHQIHKSFITKEQCAPFFFHITLLLLSPLFSLAFIPLPLRSFFIFFMCSFTLSLSLILLISVSVVVIFCCFVIFVQQIMSHIFIRSISFYWHHHSNHRGRETRSVIHIFIFHSFVSISLNSISFYTNLVRLFMEIPALKIIISSVYCRFLWVS